MLQIKDSYFSSYFLQLPPSPPILLHFIPPSHTVTMETRGNCWEIDVDSVGGDSGSGGGGGANIRESYAIVCIWKSWENWEAAAKRKGGQKMKRDEEEQRGEDDDDDDDLQVKQEVVEALLWYTVMKTNCERKKERLREIKWYLGSV